MAPPVTHFDADPPPSFKVVADLIEIAGTMPATTVVVVGGERVEDLKLVESARDHGIVERIMLIGDRQRIRRAVDQVGIEVPDEDVLAASDERAAAAAAVDLIRSRVVDIVLKGSIATPIINRHMLPLAQRRTVSLVTVFDAAPIADGRPLVMTDAGVTTDCRFERM
jgi:hypothetical protein